MTRPPEQADAGDDPLAACNRAIESIRAKANNNERLARWATGAIVMSSALIPLSIVASASGHLFVWGKLVPAALAVVSAVAAGLLQFERPHERWKLYRGYQRQLEDERFRYHNAIAPYTQADEEQRMRLLGERVSALNAGCTIIGVDWYSGAWTLPRRLLVIRHDRVASHLPVTVEWRRDRDGTDRGRAVVGAVLSAGQCPSFVSVPR